MVLLWLLRLETSMLILQLQFTLLLQKQDIIGLSKILIFSDITKQPLTRNLIHANVRNNSFVHNINQSLGQPFLLNNRHKLLKIHKHLIGWILKDHETPKTSRPGCQCHLHILIPVKNVISEQRDISHVKHILLSGPEHVIQCYRVVFW